MSSMKIFRVQIPSSPTTFVSKKEKENGNQRNNVGWLKAGTSQRREYFYTWKKKKKKKGKSLSFTLFRQKYLHYTLKKKKNTNKVSALWFPLARQVNHLMFLHSPVGLASIYNQRLKSCMWEYCVRSKLDFWSITKEVSGQTTERTPTKACNATKTFDATLPIFYIKK